MGYNPIPPSSPTSQGSSSPGASPGNDSVALPPWSKSIAIPKGNVRNLFRGLPVFMDSRRNLYRLDEENACSTPLGAKGRHFYLGRDNTLRMYAGGRVLRPNGKPYQVFNYTGAAGMPRPVPRPMDLPNLYIDAGQFGGNLEEAEMYEDECGFLYKKVDGEQPSYFYGEQDGQMYFLRRAEDKLQWVLCQPVVNEATGQPYQVQIDPVKGVTMEAEDGHEGGHEECHVAAQPERPAQEARAPAPAAAAATRNAGVPGRKNGKKRETRTSAEAKLAFGNAAGDASRTKKNGKAGKKNAKNAKAVGGNRTAQAPAAAASTNAHAPSAQAGYVTRISAESVIEIFREELQSFGNVAKGEGEPFAELMGRLKERNTDREAVLSATEYKDFLKLALQYEDVTWDQVQELLGCPEKVRPKTAAGYADRLSRFITAFEEASAGLATEGPAGGEPSEPSAPEEHLVQQWKCALKDVVFAVEELYQIYRWAQRKTVAVIDQMTPLNKKERLQQKLRKGLVLILHGIEQQAKRVMQFANWVARSNYYHAFDAMLRGQNVAGHALLGIDLYSQHDVESKLFHCVPIEDDNAAGLECGSGASRCRVAEVCHVLMPDKNQEAVLDSLDRIFIDREDMERQLPTISVFKSGYDKDLLSWTIDTARESIDLGLAGSGISVTGAIDITLPERLYGSTIDTIGKEAIEDFCRRYPDVRIVLIEP